jgi:hypothetical protein
MTETVWIVDGQRSSATVYHVEKGCIELQASTDARAVELEAHPHRQACEVCASDIDDEEPDWSHYNALVEAGEGGDD